MSKKYNLGNSFKFAFSGIKEALIKEPNFRIHIVLALSIMILAIILGLSTIDWLILLFTISFVLILELINTGLEALVDLVSPEISEKARIAKNVSAAAVLLAAILSIIVGVILFLPKIINSKIFPISFI